MSHLDPPPAPAPTAPAPGNTSYGSTPAGTTTAIHDIGYRHYDGARLAQGYLTRSLIVDGLRAAYGIGRAGKAKVMPFVLVGCMLLVALVVAVIAATTKSAPGLGYSEFGLQMQVLVVLYAAGQAPTLVSRDLRHGIMPLYFSRPLRRGRYVLSKVVAMTVATFVFVAVPVLVVYAGALLADQAFWSNTGNLGRGLVATAIQAVVVALIALTVAAYLPQRGLGLTIAIAVYIVTTIVFGVLTGVLLGTDHEAEAGWAVLASPYTTVAAVQHWVLRVESTLPFNPPGWQGGAAATALLIVVLLGCWVALQRRYRKAVTA
ncbi:MAG: ABC transporter permease subunit [Kineosporiaceae bacterium]